MSSGPEIVRPTPAQDRPGLGRLVALGVTALVLGLFLANASAEENRWLPRLGERISVATVPSPGESDRSDEGPAEPPAAAAPSPVDEPPARRPLEEASARPPSPVAALSAALEDPSNALGALSARPVAENPADRRVGRQRIGIEPGRVAYLRCDGAPEQDGLFPCPRDRGLEQRVFGAILALGTCRDLAAANPKPVGRADAWLIFRGPVLGGIRMRESPGAAPVSEAIRLCLESRLAGVRSRVESDRMTVSFRFDLR